MKKLLLLFFFFFVCGNAFAQQIVSPWGTNPNRLKQACTAAIVDTTSTAIVAAAGAGVKIYVTGYVCTNDSATKTILNFKDGTTTVWSDFVSINTIASNVARYAFQQPIVGTANTAFNVQAVTTSTSTICCAQYFLSSL